MSLLVVVVVFGVFDVTPLAGVDGFSSGVCIVGMDCSTGTASEGVSLLIVEEAVVRPVREFLRGPR
jgi:hypothetical protein